MGGRPPLASLLSAAAAVAPIFALLPWAAQSAALEPSGGAAAAAAALVAGDADDPPHERQRNGERSSLMRREAPQLVELGTISGTPAAPPAAPPDPFDAPEEAEIDSIVGSEDDAESEKLKAASALRTTHEEFWLEYGCRSLVARPIVLPNDDEAKFASVSNKVGKVQCCSNDATPRCVRKSADECFSGDGDSTLLTYSQALTTCEANNLRLCTKEELLSEDATGCCGDDCGINDKLVWTRTDRVLGAAEENEMLKTTLKQVEDENRRLEEGNDNLSWAMDSVQAGINATAAKRAAAWKLNPGWFPPLPDDQNVVKNMTEEEADKMREENAKLEKEKTDLAHQTRRLKNNIIEMVNSSIHTGRVDPSTLPEHRLWPLAKANGAPVEAECDTCETKIVACDNCGATPLPTENPDAHKWHTGILQSLLDTRSASSDQRSEPTK